MANHVFEKYRNSAMPHGKKKFKTASDMAMATMCVYLSYIKSLQHWKFFMRFCV